MYSERPMNHPFLASIKRVKFQLGIDENIWKMWKEEIIQTYVTRNFDSLPLDIICKLCDKEQLKQVQVDGRNIIDTLYDLNTKSTNNCLEILNLKRKLEIMERKMNYMEMSLKEAMEQNKIQILHEMKNLFGSDNIETNENEVSEFN